MNRKTQFSNCGLVLVMVALAASPCFASWAYVPQEIRIAEADLVVAGQVTSYGKDVKKDGQVYQVGVIKTIQLLKGKAKMSDDIRLAWPKRVPGGLRVSTDLPAPKVGQKGVWVLQADEKLPVYWASYPTDRQPFEKLAEMKKKVAALAAVKWSEPKDGLQIGFIAEQRDLRNSKLLDRGKPVKAVAQISVYTIMRNVSMEPIHVSNYIYNDPFTIEFIGPDGKDINVPTFRKPLKKPAPRIHNFVLVKPNQIRQAGYGLALPRATVGGDYTIRLTHKNSLDAKALKIANVWKGELSTAPVKVNVPK